MVSVIDFAFAAFFNAIMDTMNDHYGVSVFSNLNPKFWDKSVSWQVKKFLGIVVLDAWHIAKYGFIISITVMANCPSLNIRIGYNLFLYFSVWFIVFEGFYSKILVKKKS